MRFNWLWRRRKASMPSLPMDQIRKRAKLLVIDDKEFPYKVLFDRDGYSLEKWDDVQDMNRLESRYYDLILLDLHGVGKKFTEKEGLGILKSRSQNLCGLGVAS